MYFKHVVSVLCTATSILGIDIHGDYSNVPPSCIDYDPKTTRSTPSHDSNPLLPCQPSPPMCNLSSHVNPFLPCLASPPMSTLSSHVNSLLPCQPSPPMSTLSSHVNDLLPCQPSPPMSTLSSHVNPFLPCLPSPPMSTLSSHVNTLLPYQSFPPMSTLSSHVNPLLPCLPSPPMSTLSSHVNTLLPYQSFPPMSTLSSHVNPLLPCLPSPPMSTLSSHVNTLLQYQPSPPMPTLTSHVNALLPCPKLPMSKTKTECIVFSRNKDPTSITVTVGTQSIDSQHTVKILGVTFDNNMTFQNHVSNIWRSIHMNIRKIRRIRKYLTYEAVKTLVQCTVTVRLDYCNSLYCGLPLKTIKKLQLAQNAAAGLIAKISISHNYTHRSSLASCHKAMPI